MNEKVILNVATGDFYCRGQKRLLKSLEDFNYTGDKLFWSDTWPPNSPSHCEVPYGFKTYAFKEAQRLGYKYAIWLDSSMHIIRPLDDIFKLIEENDVLSIHCGYQVGQWCSDDGLKKLKISRDESFNIPLIMGGVLGINLESERGKSLLEYWHARAQDGSFNGPWKNINNEISDDNRVGGHRHDMPSLSYIIQKLDIKVFSGPHIFSYAQCSGGNPNESTYILATGIPTKG